jgi:phosphonate transport system substrate-binding protein
LGKQTLLSRRHLLAAAALAAGAAPRLGRAAEMPAPGRRAWADQVPVLRIGLLGGENENDRLARYDKYHALLQDTFDIPVKLYPAADYAGVIQAFAAKQIEMAGMGASGYAAAYTETNGNVEPLVVAVEEDGSISYRSVMVVRADSGITSLADMKGHSLAWADPNSTSGYLIPRFELRAEGYDTEPGRYFSQTGFGGGHEQAVVAVLQRQYDAAVTWASGVGDESKGFSRGNLRAMADKGLLKMSDIRIIWTSKPILNGPLTVRLDTPQAFRDDMVAFHMALPDAHPDVYAQIETGGGRGYQRVKAADYQIFIDLRQEEAAQRHRR